MAMKDRRTSKMVILVTIASKMVKQIHRKETTKWDLMNRQ